MAHSGTRHFDTDQTFGGHSRPVANSEPIVPMGHFAKGLYYALQRFRRGVTQGMVREASELLDRPWSEIESYVELRLERNFGLPTGQAREWLRDQPVRSKQDYSGNGVEVSGIGDLHSSLSRKTSGSSGKPFQFRRDRTMLAWMDAAMWAAYSWHGIEPGDRMARFWGRPLSGIERFQRRITDTLLRQRRMSAFEVSPEQSCAFFDEMKRWDPHWAYGYPTLIRKFVEHTREDGKDGHSLNLKAVITTGEMLDQSTRGTLGEFFGCPVVDEYGCSESGILSIECEAGTSHLLPVAASVEIEDDSELPPPREGPVLITDLYGSTMPFVRYKLDDVARLHSAEKCACGRELPQLDVLAGRSGDFIRTPDGHVYSAVLAYSVPDGVAQFQVRQTDIAQLQGQVVVAEGFDPGKVCGACERNWRDGIGADLDIDVQAVDHIQRTASGKHRYFLPLHTPSAQDEDAVGDS